MLNAATPTENERIVVGPYQTIEEIEAQYPDHWIWIDRPAQAPTGKVIGGHVIFASQDRDERDAFLGRHVGEFSHLASHITKRPPPGTDFLVSVWDLGGGKS